jgi:hypothetical protein
MIFFYSNFLARKIFGYGIVAGIHNNHAVGIYGVYAYVKLKPGQKATR